MLEKGEEEDAKEEGDLVGGCVRGVDVVGGLCGSGSERGVMDVDGVLDVGVYQDEHDSHAQDLVCVGVDWKEEESVRRVRWERRTHVIVLRSFLLLTHICQECEVT